MGVGFLHGVLPQGLSRSYFFTPTKIQVLTTDEILFPQELRAALEEEHNVKFSVTVTRDWETFLANAVSSPSVDLLFFPSFWAQTLQQQNLLSDISELSTELPNRVASDFLGFKGGQRNFFFFPFYWLKTGIIPSSNQESFLDFIKSKNKSTLFLLADEDLLLKHFQEWKSQGLWEQIAQKKILTLQLESLRKEVLSPNSASEVPVIENLPNEFPRSGALLIWGAAIPHHASQKQLSLEILTTLSSPLYQEKTLLKTPFNSALSTVTGNQIPLHRRADHIRNLQLTHTLIIERKEQDARLKLKTEFNFAL
ncbi:MAG: hypothetical protein AAGB31_01245 [Bdellovibrio sp.]